MTIIPKTKTQSQSHNFLHAVKKYPEQKLETFHSSSKQNFASLSTVDRKSKIIADCHTANTSSCRLIKND